MECRWSTQVWSCKSNETQLIAVLTVAFLSLTVTLSAAPPSYFRGFTLIALKENREGDKEEDHAGTFQVRHHSLPLPFPVAFPAWQVETEWALAMWRILDKRRG